MADRIAVKSNAFSSKSLKTALKELQTANKSLNDTMGQQNAGEVVYYSPADRYVKQLFSGATINNADAAYRELHTIQTELERIAGLLDSGPEEIVEADRDFKGKKSNAWQRTIIAIGGGIGGLFKGGGNKTGKDPVTIESEDKSENQGTSSNSINNSSYPGSVHINDNPDYPSNKGRHITPAKANFEGRRNPEAYNEVLDSFDVENRDRYQQDSNGDTWCNVYVSDVTYAMGCEIPHYYDPETGDPLPDGAPGGRYTSAAGIRDWLSEYGEQHGWVECDAETAQNMANQGYPTMALDTSGEHVAMVAPQREGETGVQISQAGWKNFNHAGIAYGWNNSYQLKYYYHL